MGEDRELDARAWAESPAAGFMWARRGETFALESVNEAALALSHGTAEHFIGRSLEEIYPDRGDVPELVRAASRGDTVELDAPYAGRGTRLEMRLVFRAVPLRDGRVCLYATPHDRAREAPAPSATAEGVRASVKRFLFEQGRASVYVWRMVEDDFELSDYNQTSVRATQGRVAGLLGHRASVVYREQPLVLEALRYARERDTYVHSAFPYREITTGQDLTYRLASFRLGAHVVILTEPCSDAERHVAALAKQIEERDTALRLSEATLHAITAESSVGFLRTSAEGDVREANARFETLHGALGSRWLEAVRESDRGRVTEALRGACACETRQVEYGTEAGRTVLADVMQLGSSELLIVALDTTEAQEARERAAVAQARYERAERLQTVGRLAGGIAHDFNNLLAAAASLAELIAEDAPNEGIREDAEAIQEIADRGAALTGQLLSVARRQTLAPAALDLPELVHGMRPMLARALGEDIAIEVREAPGALRRVFADRSQLEQVLLNLAVNAREAMPRGGALTFAIQPASEDADLAPPPPATRFVELRVTDTGVGIAPENLERVFEPFFTTKEDAGGAGLGLATVLGVVEQSGGRVEVDSTVGDGTTFRLLLPALRGEPRAPTAPGDGPSRAPGAPTPRRVLLVEDNAPVRRALTRILRRGGHEVLTADGAEQAHRVLRERGPIDALVTDVVMPGPSGPELAIALRRTFPGLPVIFMSGYHEEDLSEVGALADARFLAKPVKGAVLLRAIEELARDAEAR